MLSHLASLQVVVPMLAAPLCVIINRSLWAWLLVMMVTVTSFIIALLLWYQLQTATSILYAMGGWIPPLGIEYRIDKVTGVMLLLVTFIAVMTSIYAKFSVENEIDRHKHGLFYAMFLLCFAGLLGLLLTHDAFNIYVFLEISSLAMYALIAVGKDRRALLAAFEYLILGTVGAAFILIAVGLLYMMTGTLNISDIAMRLDMMHRSIPVLAALAFFVVGLFLKIGIFPLHVWLTNAYTNAPSFVSAFLSATATKVSLFLLIKIIFMLFGAQLVFTELSLGNVWIILGALGMLVGAGMAVFQDNIKRMLAYSSVSQISYVLLAIGLSSHDALGAAFFQIVSHALAKVTLFMAVGCMIYQVGGSRLHHISGIAKTMPWIFGCFLIGGAGLIGIPGTVGFMSKWLLLSSIIQQPDLWPLMIIVLLSSVLAAIYVWRAVEQMYFKESVKVRHHEVVVVPRLMVISTCMMAACVILFGIYSEPLVKVSMTLASLFMNQ